MEQCYEVLAAQLGQGWADTDLLLFWVDTGAKGSVQRRLLLRTSLKMRDNGGRNITLGRAGVARK